MFKLIAFGKIERNDELKKLFFYFHKMLKTKVQIVELNIKDSLDPELIKRKEFELIKANIKQNDTNIILTEHGKIYDSSEFAKFIKHLLTNSYNVNFIISGACGFDKAIETITHHQLSLSKLTFPHLWTRLLLIEQLYRAQTIMNGHPYHK